MATTRPFSLLFRSGRAALSFDHGPDIPLPRGRYQQFRVEPQDGVLQLRLAADCILVFQLTTLQANLLRHVHQMDWGTVDAAGRIVREGEARSTTAAWLAKPRPVAAPGAAP